MRKLLIITLLPLLGAALFGSGCTPENQCQYQWTEYCAFGVPACTPESSINDVPDGGPPCCAGHLVNATTWESGPLFGTWLDYSHNKNIHMHLRDAVTGAQLTGYEPVVTSYSSPVAMPNSPGGQFAEGAGDLERALSRGGRQHAGLHARHPQQHVRRLLHVGRRHDLPVCRRLR